MALRRACTLATTTVLATGLLTAAVMTPAAAAPTAVEVETVADQLVDRDGATLWLAGSKGVGYGTSPVGRTLIDGTAGAHSLAQAADGTVYASSDHALTRIAADHSVTTVAAGEYDCLGDVAVTTGAVWVVSACDDTHPQLVRIADGTVTADAVTVDEPGSMRLASASGAPDELVVSDHVSTDVQDEDGTHSTVVPRVRVLDTTGAAPVQKFVTTLTPSDAAPVLALSRDGSRLVAGVDADFRMFDVRTQSTAGVRLPAYGETVASAGVSDDGRFAALVTLSTNAAFVLVYAADGTRLTSHGYGVDSAGVAWQGSALAVVTHQATADSDSLVILPTAYRNRPEVYLRDQDVRAYWGQRITVIGDAITDTGDPARGLRLTVSRSGPDGTRTLGTTTVGASGQFSWNDTAPVAGTFRYKFSVVVDDVWTAAFGVATWAFGKHTAGLSITTNHSRYVVGQPALVTATLARRYKNKTVTIYASGGGHSKQLVRRGVVNSAGKISARIYVPWTTTLSVSYAGDARYSAASAHVTRYAKARVDTALSKPARKSHGYYVYSARKGSAFYAAVRPAHKGSTVHFVLQRYTHGHWRSYLYGTVKQTKDGTAGIRYAGKPGVKYRERAYVGNTSYALANTSSWRYLTFAR